MFLKELLVYYLDTAGELTHLQEKIDEYVARMEGNETGIPENFICPIFIDLIELEQYGQLSRLLITEPDIVQNAVNELIKMTLSSKIDHKKKIQKEQIITPVILNTTLQISSNKLQTGLHFTRGIVAAHTISMRYVRTSIWKCNAVICTSLNPIVCKQIPKSRPICAHCAAPLEEQSKSRMYGSFMKLQICDSDLSTCKWTEVRIYDERSCDLLVQLGVELAIVGVRRYDYIEVWGCEKLQYKYIENNSYTSKIGLMKRRLMGSAWSFVQELSNVIGGESLPPGIYSHLRMGLLLSLASISSLKPIPILALCDSTETAYILMKSASSMTSKCVRPILPCNLGAQIEGDWRVAGSLLLASEGVCYLGDFDSYLGNKGIPVKTAIETGRVVFDGGDGEFIPLRAAVWTYLDKPTKKKNESRLQTLLKVFGLMWRVDYDPITEEAMVDCLLDPNNLQKPDISVEEMRHYLESINTIPVTLTDGALDLLKRYFVGARRVRGENLPLTSLDPLTALTEAHARLNQRELAYPEDALVAVELCERSLGPCPLIPKPPEPIWEFGEWLKEHVLISNGLTQFTQGSVRR